MFIYCAWNAIERCAVVLFEWVTNDVHTTESVNVRRACVLCVCVLIAAADRRRCLATCLNSVCWANPKSVIHAGFRLHAVRDGARRHINYTFSFMISLLFADFYYCSKFEIVVDAISTIKLVCAKEVHKCNEQRPAQFNRSCVRIY